MDENDIVKVANKKKNGTGAQSRMRPGSSKSMRSSKMAGQNQNDNDWIPTEAVRTIMQIKEDCKGVMSEICVSQILYKLNTIWRNIMRKENDAIKKRLNAQIQDLRR